MTAILYCSQNQSSHSAGIPSSMETIPTDLVDGFESEEDEHSKPEIWGRLFPVGASFACFDLSKDEYAFGRGDECDYQFNTPAMRQHPCFQAYSKIHFKVVREQTSTGKYTFVVDNSSNGTFINGEKVGKGCKQALNNNDEIALAMKRNKAFVFMDALTNEDDDLPPEIKDKYTMSKLLGRGACGEVRLAFEKGSCRKVAVKVIQKKKFSVGGKTQINSDAQIMNEVKILKSIKHPCIISVEDLIDTPSVLYIVLELVEGGELFDRVVSVKQFDEPTSKLLFYQMVLGVKYLHDRDITHRDLKPENILLAGESNETLIKVTDFGLSKFVDSSTMMKTFCGTPNYLAPEVLLGAGAGFYTKAIDCWSLGVILFICLAGYPPFTEERKDLTLPKQIMGGHYDFPKQHWKNVSNDAIDLIKRLMTVEPEKRITLTEALSHPWLKDDGMHEKANKLMYPLTESMGPPNSNQKKRRFEGMDGENGEKGKRKGTQDDTL